MHVVAVDAGGTKARFNVYTPTGELLAREVLPTAHPAQVGFDGMAGRLREGVSTALALAGVDSDDAVCSFGLAGYGPGREEPIERVIRETFPGMPIVIASDAEAARLGALGGCDGILLIAGTGSIAVSEMGGVRRRAGGWGRAFGDEGSGYWIGRRALGLASKQADGRCPKTRLLPLVCGEFGVEDPYDLVEAVRSSDDERGRVAAIVPALGDLARDGDPAARGIFDEAGRELAGLANALVDGDGPVMCSWAGGVFARGETIMVPLRESLDARIRLVEPKEEPVWGSYLAACKAFGDMLHRMGGKNE